MKTDSIKQRLRTIEEKIKPGEARIIVTIDGKKQEVSVSEFLDHRFEWEFEDVIGDRIAPVFFILLKLTDDGISEELEKGTDPKSPKIVELENDRERYLWYIERSGGLA